MDRAIRRNDIDEKALLRKLILEKRRALPDKGRREKSLAIQQRFFLLDEFRQGRVIHLFLSFRGEVMTDGIVKEALALGKQVVVPVVVGGSEGMNLSEIRQYPDEVEAGAYGIPEPKKKFIRRVDPATVDLFVLPGVAFDVRGGRLGYGAGYYDRILGGTVPSRESKRVSLIALAFELQLVDRIPSSVHDVRVHKIITEERVIECMKSGMY